MLKKNDENGVQSTSSLVKIHNSLSCSGGWSEPVLMTEQAVLGLTSYFVQPTLKKHVITVLQVSFLSKKN